MKTNVTAQLIRTFVFAYAKIRCSLDAAHIEIIIIDNLSLVMRKSAICICENKDADQLRGNREADLFIYTIF